MALEAVKFNIEGNHMDWRDNVPEWLAESWDTLNTDMKTVIYVMASGVKKYNLWKNT